MPRKIRSNSRCSAVLKIVQLCPNSIVSHVTLAHFCRETGTCKACEAERCGLDCVAFGRICKSLSRSAKPSPHQGHVINKPVCRGIRDLRFEIRQCDSPNTENLKPKTQTVISDSDLVIGDSSQTIGSTSNHPFWSEDRQDFVQAVKLRF